MNEIYETLGAVVFGGITVYGFFWNQGRAKKADETALVKLISDGNISQDKETEKQNDHQHKRINKLVEDTKEVQYELGYNKGYREGEKAGRAEVRAQQK